jgi:hypothetical protein
MSRLVRLGVVLAGYVAAVLAACAAVDVRQLHTQGEHVQASAGMYAFGDALLFLAVFGFAALFPTGLALHFLRSLPLFLDRTLDNGLGPCRYGSFGRIGLHAGVFAAAPWVPVGYLGVACGSANACSTPAGRCLLTVRAHRAHPSVAMGATRSRRDRGRGGHVRRSPLVRIVPLYIDINTRRKWL